MFLAFGFIFYCSLNFNFIVLSLETLHLYFLLLLQLFLTFLSSPTIICFFVYRVSTRPIWKPSFPFPPYSLCTERYRVGRFIIFLTLCICSLFVNWKHFLFAKRLMFKNCVYLYSNFSVGSIIILCDL